MAYLDEYRDNTIQYQFRGDVAVAKTHTKLAQKLGEKLQGSLDHGANLGHGINKSFIVDDFTTIDVAVHPGVTNPMLRMTITSTGGAPSEEEEEGGESQKGFGCPQPPFGILGQRMFISAAATLYGSSFRGVTVTSEDFKFSTPLTIAQQLDPDTIFARRGVIELVDPDEGQLQPPGTAPTIMLMGERRHTIWVGDNFGNFNFSGPLTRNVNTGPNIVDSTCSRGIGAGPILYDVGNGVEASFEGHEDLKYYISLAPAALRVQFQGTGGIVFFTEGVDKNTLHGVRDSDIPADIPPLKRRALIMFHNHAGVEREAVYLYPEENCPAHLGFFFNGSDSPSLIGGGDALDFTFDTLGFCDPDLPFKGSSPDVYTMEFVCSGKPQEDCPEIVNVFGFLAQEYNFFAVGNGNRAVVLNVGTGGGTFAAKDIFNGRSFWLELNEQGFPNGTVYVQPPPEDQDPDDRTLVGDPSDLLVRIDGPAAG